MRTLFVGEGQKNQEWHEQYASHLYNWCQLPPIAAFNNTRDFFMGQESDDEYIWLTTNAAFESLAGPVPHLNSVIQVVNELTGRMSQIGRDFTIRGMSKNAKIRRQQGENRIKVDYMLRGLLAIDQEMTGIPTMKGVPITEEELDDMLERYKERGEEIYTSIVQHEMRKRRWEAIRPRLIQDILLYGRCFYSVRLDQNGYVQADHVNVRNVAIGTDGDAWGHGARCICIVQFIPEHVAMTRYGVTEEDIKKGAGKSINIGGTPVNLTSEIGGVRHLLHTKLEFADSATFDVLERKGYWKLQMSDPDSIPKEYDQQASMSRRKKQYGKRGDVPYEVIRFVEQVAGKTVEWGIAPNTARKPDDWQFASGFSIKQFIPDRHNDDTGASSVASRVINLQRWKNETAAKVKELQRQDKGKQVVLDDAMASGKHTSTIEADALAQATGVFSYNSMAGGLRTDGNPPGILDRSISASVQIHLAIMEYLDREIAEISGSSSDLRAQTITVGVNQSLQERVGFRNYMLFAGFQTYIEEIWTHMLGLAKICIMAKPELYQYVIGDDGLAYIQSNPDFELDDYGLFVMADVSPQVRQMIYAAAERSIQTGAITPIDGIEVMLRENPHEALAILKKRDGQRQQMMMQMQMAAQEAQSAQAQQELAIKNKLADASMARPQADIEAERIRAESRREGKVADTNIAAGQAQTEMAKELLRGRQQADRLQ